jgi:hypothetical protein
MYMELNNWDYDQVVQNCDSSEHLLAEMFDKVVNEKNQHAIVFNKLYLAADILNMLDESMYLKLMDDWICCHDNLVKVVNKANPERIFYTWKDQVDLQLETSEYEASLA